MFYLAGLLILQWFYAMNVDPDTRDQKQNLAGVETCPFKRKRATEEGSYFYNNEGRAKRARGHESNHFFFIFGV